jgi:hypothetical protein
MKTWLPEEFQLHNASIKIWKKEKTDFDLIYNKTEYIEKYLQAPQGAIKGDCSPIYLVTYKDTIPNILELIDKPYDIKFIFILRNPIEACISYFKMFVRLWWEKRTFEEAIEWELKGDMPNGCPYLSIFLYFDAIKAYKDTFWKNVKVFYFEEINNESFLDEICEFLDIYKHSNVFPHENKGIDYVRNEKLNLLLKDKKVPEKLKEYLESKNLKKIDFQLSKETKHLLDDFYAHDITQLYGLLWNKNILNWKNKI